MAADWRLGRTFAELTFVGIIQRGASASLCKVSKWLHKARCTYSDCFNCRRRCREYPAVVV